MSLDPQAVSMQDAVGVAALLDAAAASLLAQPARRGSSVMLPRRGRILLTGDLHDSLAHFRIVVAEKDFSRLAHDKKAFRINFKVDASIGHQGTYTQTCSKVTPLAGS